ncbi:hypothetical protein A2U01_0048931, partial [Trifolium medium]|nr:hypothetical protein [Trifolium medium]
MTVEDRSQELLHCYKRIAADFFKGAALLASGPISFEFVPFTERIQELEGEVARLNEVVATQRKERENDKKTSRKRIKKLEKSNGELEGCVSSLDKEVATLQASLEQKEKDLASLNERLQTAVTIARRAIGTGFEEALKQVEKNYPDMVLDRSVYKPLGRSAVK